MRAIKKISLKLIYRIDEKKSKEIKSDNDYYCKVERAITMAKYQKVNLMWF